MYCLEYHAIIATTLFSNAVLVQVWREIFPAALISARASCPVPKGGVAYGYPFQPITLLP
ncbi:hypothetical protein M404DRAFT_1000929 [Pisolithus tinctorius Marx 270]|uniref:Uncharacterized protein n=1 Tax=Pisolithus tinctorius Marx 270 TaxID=870435 RepID=A0A0C3J4V6_PISTI|nr:hypothetical protein M404DRAFT_1000929 [Pisolithus tinctorius Marx 270]